MDHNKQAATELARAAKIAHANGIIYSEDLDNLLTVAKDIQVGDLECAIRYASLLDTAVREEIPQDVWKHMGGKLISEMA